MIRSVASIVRYDVVDFLRAIIIRMAIIAVITDCVVVNGSVQESEYVSWRRRWWRRYWTRLVERLLYDTTRTGARTGA